MVDEKEEKEKDSDVISEKWSKFRLLVAAAIVVVALVVGINLASSVKLEKEKSPDSSVLGTQEDLPTEEEIGEILDTAQKELRKINPEDVIAEQDAINRIITDLESLKKTTSNPQEYLCNTFCPREKN